MPETWLMITGENQTSSYLSTNPEAHLPMLQERRL